MRRPISILFALALGGCGDTNGNTPDASVDTVRPPQGYGAACTKDDECESKLCVAEVCSKLCKRQLDCPTVENKPYECGEVPTLKKVACYPRRYPTGKGGLGYDCTLDQTCGVGYKCMGQPGTTERYCSRECSEDWDCPPRLRCSKTRTGKDPAETKGWCRRRDFCHPCAIDDQCGPDNLCITDINKNRYCGKSCSGGGTCPSYAKCEDAGNGKQQCKHKAGYCYKNLASESDLCEPCFVHGWVGTPTADFAIAEDGICKKEGFCYLLSTYSMEAGCLMPCGSGDTCPTSAKNYACADLKSLGGKYCVPTTIDPDSGQKIFGSCAP